MTSYMGVTGVATGLFHASLTKAIPLPTLLFIAGISLTFYNLVTAFTTSLSLYIVLQPVAALSHLVLSTSTLAAFSQAFEQREVGLALGVGGSVNSIGDILSPLVAGVLFNYVGMGGPRMVSAILIFTAFSLFLQPTAGLELLHQHKD